MGELAAIGSADLFVLEWRSKLLQASLIVQQDILREQDDYVNLMHHMQDSALTCTSMIEFFTTYLHNLEPMRFRVGSCFLCRGGVNQKFLLQRKFLLIDLLQEHFEGFSCIHSGDHETIVHGKCSFVTETGFLHSILYHAAFQAERAFYHCFFILLHV